MRSVRSRVQRADPSELLFDVSLLLRRPGRDAPPEVRRDRQSNQALPSQNPVGVKEVRVPVPIPVIDMPQRVFAANWEEQAIIDERIIKASIAKCGVAESRSHYWSIPDALGG